MKEKTYKLFWKINEIHRKVYSIVYPNDKEYYEFIEEQHKKGFRQITITSELMIKLIKKLVIENNININEILFLNDDKDIQKDIEYEISHVTKNTKDLTSLIKTIEFYTKENNIDIKRICFNGYIKTQKQAIIYMQANGILGIKGESYNIIKTYIANIIESEL